MNRQSRITQILSVLKPQFLEIKDQSKSHQHHLGNSSGEETHYKITITSSMLDGQPRINQHRQINDLLKDEFTNGLHSIRIIIKDNNYETR